ncbi:MULTISPECIES: class I SAM-dependent methyltransferase [Methylobacterium]|jgi:predicted O-methyltransferase YrrM|uniref:class I SAM-dependent methyltransferase n=2 Tax=Methylobacteriaceae TaxID=119045 RepID=UPI0008F0B6EF|nr:MULTISPECIES: class I SAM-dependent methyltransferase [Methylobacterium]MBK3396748.1 class I SAM-dependent methyltransferase [Methylobacterium ajmalii]MBK3407320.1 class I SAM-dependent methyltransferase [Methylobacterium ajmalii]MBZ6414047.1 class I SAM-dependent methyltransferase [Methylobacterium sp.]SFF34576.1 Predicted O-methyltransferase YrrM [Methylobacterium sp. yr596]
MTRTRLRRAGLGLRALLGLPAGGFLIPYRHAGAARAEGYPALRPLFCEAEPAFRSVLAEIEAHAPDLARIAAGGPGLVGERPARFAQDWFPRLDAAAAYALVRRERPARIVEIGSGHSTRFLAQAVRDGDLPTAITCIDPAPRAPLAGLGLRHEARLFGPADAEEAAALDPGDMLFIDSSHVAMPGTDVDRLILDVLPRLRSGVIVHLHDIFLPDAYPASWAWRGYNEQLLVGALLQGGAYAPLFASRYVATRAGRSLDGILARLPLPEGAFETSLWLRKR